MIVVSVLFSLGIITAGAICITCGMVAYWYDVFKLIGMMIGFIIAYNILYFLILYIITLFLDPEKDVERPKPFFLWNTHQVTELFDCYSNIRVHIIGEEKFPKDTRFLFVSNHRSAFDPIVVLASMFDHEIAFVSKPSNLKIPVIGMFIRKCCFLPIDRDNPRNALKTILRAVKYIEDDITSIGIYPEGTRSKGKELGPFKPGSLKIAQKAGVPIVVASMRGTEMVTKNWPRRTDVYIDILEVISKETITENKTVDMTEKVREIIENDLIAKGDIPNGQQTE